MALGAVRYWGVGLDWTRWSWMSLPTQNSVKIQFQSGKESIAAKFLSGRSMEAKFNTSKSFPKHNLHLFYVFSWVSLRKSSTHRIPVSTSWRQQGGETWDSRWEFPPCLTQSSLNPKEHRAAVPGSAFEPLLPSFHHLVSPGKGHEQGTPSSTRALLQELNNVKQNFQGWNHSKPSSRIPLQGV